MSCHWELGTQCSFWLWPGAAVSVGGPACRQCLECHGGNWNPRFFGEILTQNITDLRQSQDPDLCWHPPVECEEPRVTVSAITVVLPVSPKFYKNRRLWEGNMLPGSPTTKHCRVWTFPQGQNELSGPDGSHWGIIWALPVSLHSTQNNLKLLKMLLLAEWVFWAQLPGISMSVPPLGPRFFLLLFPVHWAQQGWGKWWEHLSVPHQSIHAATVHTR